MATATFLAVSYDGTQIGKIISSSNIHAYPCISRGDTQGNEATLAKVTTEYNVANSYGGETFTIEKPATGTTGKVKLTIAGYYFELSEVAASDLANFTHCHIKLSRVLMPITESQAAVLDVQSAGVYYFYGLLFNSSATPPAISGGTWHTLNLSDTGSRTTGVTSINNLTGAFTATGGIRTYAAAGQQNLMLRLAANSGLTVDGNQALKVNDQLIQKKLALISSNPIKINESNVIYSSAPVVQISTAQAPEGAPVAQSITVTPFDGNPTTYKLASGSGGEPAAYIKSITKNGNTLVWLNKDNTTGSYVPNVGVTSVNGEGGEIRVPVVSVGTSTVAGETARSITIDSTSYNLPSGGGGTTYTAGSGMSLANNTFSVKNGAGLGIASNNDLIVKYKDPIALDANNTLGIALSAVGGLTLDTERSNSLSVDFETVQHKLTVGGGILISDNTISARTGNGTVISESALAVDIGNDSLEFNDDGQLQVNENQIQHKLTAGTGITIDNNTISATGGGSYLEGSGIQIANNTISARVGSGLTFTSGNIAVMPGSGIQIGDMGETGVNFNTVQRKLTAGTGITIDSDNKISATGGGSAYAHYINIWAGDTAGETKGDVYFTLINGESSAYTSVDAVMNVLPASIICQGYLEQEETSYYGSGRVSNRDVTIYYSSSGDFISCDPTSDGEQWEHCSDTVVSL